MDAFERRYVADAAFAIEKRADGKMPMMVGYPAKFNVLSEPLWGFREKINPGAFKQTLADGADVRALQNHDPNLLLGRSVAGTLRLREDQVGLRMEADLPDTTYARDLQVLLDRGDISQGSFQFRVPPNGDSWGQDADGNTIRELNQVHLKDVSVVTFPAYTDTPISLRALLWPEGVPEELLVHVPDLRATKTKRVDGEDLPASAFAFVGDANDTSTWKLPIRFSSAEKTKSHIRNALARFNQTKGIPTGEKPKVWGRITAAAKKHGIAVSGAKAAPGEGMEMRRRRLALAARL